MGDVARCFQDGYSTAGSAGTGLGAIRAAVHRVPMSTPCAGKGTALLARVRKHGRQNRRGERFEIGGVCVPQRGETLCGDGFVVEQEDRRLPGAGGGRLGTRAGGGGLRGRGGRRFSGEPVNVVARRTDARGARGAAEPRAGRRWRSASSTRRRANCDIAGIGNISGFIWRNGQSRHLLSHPGIVGHDVRDS